MANSTIGALNVKITADATSVKAGLRQTNKALTTTTKKAKTANKAFSDFSGALNLNTLALSAALGVAATKAVKYADAFTSINNKLKLATADSEQLTIVTDKLFESSNNTGSSIEASVELYAKLERSTRTLGISQDKLLNITDSINKAFIISGASTAEASGAIRQLGQALSSGVLRGEEFNSISEQAPVIMEAVSKATGKTVGQLKKLAAEGKITSKVLIESLERYKKKIDKDYATAQKTFAQKLEKSTNEVIRFVGESKSLNLAVDNIGDALVSASENMETIGNILQGVLIIAIGKYTAGMVAAAAATKVSTLATAANVAAKTAQTKADLRQAKVALGFAVQEQAAAKRMLAGTTNTIIRARAVDKLAIANGRLAAAQAVVTAGTTKLAAAQGVATGAALGLRTAMGFLGGPVGVIIMAGLALASFIDWSDDAAVSSKLTAKEVDNLKKSYKALSDQGKALKLKEITDEMLVNRAEAKALADDIKRLTSAMDLPSNSRGVAGFMFQIGEAKDKVAALGIALGLLKAKQEVLDPKDKPKGEDGELINIDDGGEANEKFLKNLRDRFLSETQLEKNRHKQEKAALIALHSDRSNLTKAQQDLEENLEKGHQENLANIKKEESEQKIDSDKFLQELKNQFLSAEQLEKNRYKQEKADVRKLHGDKNELTKAQQALELNLEKGHQENLAKIKQADIEKDDESNQYIQALKNQFLSAKELEKNRYNQEKADLVKVLAEKGELLSDHNELVEDLETNHKSNMREIEQRQPKTTARFEAALEEQDSVYKAELAALRSSFNNKNDLTVEQQEQEATLEAAHLEKMRVIKSDSKTADDLLVDSGAEEEKYALELEALRSSFENKKILTQEQQLALEELEALHLAKMQGIKDSMQPVDTSIGILEALGLQYQTEETMLIESLARKQAILDAALANKSISEDEHEKQTLTIKQQGEEAKRKITLQNVQEGFSILASGSKKAQKLLQGVAVAQAVVSGYGAAVEAWRMGMASGGPWVAAAYTAASVAKTAGMISQMKSSGSSMASSGGGTPSTSGGSSAGGSTMQQAAPQQAQISAPQVSRTIDINLPSTGLLSVDQVRELMEQINEQVGDGVQLNTGNI